MKNIIFLIISSYDIPAYCIMKNIIDLYCEKSKKKYSLKHFFLEFSKSIPDNILVKENTIYVKGEESIIPGIFYKTMHALMYINNNYDYDIVIRTNLSSFFNLDNLYKLIDTKIFDNNNIAVGYRPFNTFISGTSIILPKKVSLKLCNKERNNSKIHDDVLISRILKKIGISLISLPGDNRELMMIDINQQVPDDISNILFFRVKSQDRAHDSEVFKRLAIRIYDINV